MNKFCFYILIFFLASRAFILFTPPVFSDVKTDYERYANMWYYGLTPYKEHLYEYPPATIPLLLLPLILDQKGVGKYYSNYRLQILLIDIAFFVFLALSLKKLKIHSKGIYKILFFYIFFTNIARAFLYEGIDLVFSSAIISSFLILGWFKKRNFIRKSLCWLFFWISTSIKFLTFPMIIPLFLITKNKIKKDLLIILSTFMLVWGSAILIFGTSLSVSFVYNFARPIKYASFPAYIINVINLFTLSEKQIDKAPDFEYYGPISESITKINRYAFPLIMTIFVFWAIKESILWLKIKEKNKTSQIFYLLKIYGVYLFILFLSAKTFSQPFHIWYLALISLFIPKIKKPCLMILSCLIMILLDMTAVFHFTNNFTFFNIVSLSVIKDAFRFIPMIILIGLFKNHSILNTKRS